MRDIGRDVHLALSSLRRAPGFCAAAVLSLAIGIGAATALFSVVHAVLFTPLPYRDADRLTELWNRSPGLDIAEDWFSTAQYFDIATSHSGFETLALALGANYNLTDPGTSPERVGAIRASSNLLPMLGATPQYGQLFVEADDHPGRPATAILSDRLWRRRYGGDPAIIGRTIGLNGVSTQVLGVLPASFALPRDVLPTLGVAEDGDVFLPLPLSANAASVRTREDYNIMGVLKRGVRGDDAQREMDELTARLRRDHPDVYPPNGGLTFSIVPVQQQVAGRVSRPLAVLTGAVALVLLIACANVANLLLSRGFTRQRALAVQAELGAGRSTLVRQQLSEAALLAGAGALLGLVLASTALRWLHAHPPAELPSLGEIAINGSVLTFAVAVTAAAAVLSSLAPMVGVWRIDVQSVLRDDSRGASGTTVWSSRHGIRRWLVAGELAVAVVLLIGATLLMRSLTQLSAVAPGFEPARVLTFEVTLTAPKYKDGAAVIEGYRRLWEHLGSLSGVSAAGGVTSLPLSGFFAWGPITVEGRVPPPGEKFLNADQRSVSGDYFTAMRIPLKAGRLFTDTDAGAPAPRVVVIDDRMADTLWPGQDPIGKRIKYGDAAADSPWETVVGVVGRVKQYGLDADARIAFYRPHRQSPARALFVAVHTTGAVETLAASLPGAMRAFDPDLPLYHVQPMTRRVDDSLARQRFATRVLGAFAVIAVLLAVIGVYGVMAFQVAQGRREIGIRVALGASPRAIVAMVLGRAAAIAVIGIGAGTLGALALSRAIAALVYGISARDVTTFVAVPLGLAAVALAAAALPARSAARTNATDAIRQ